MRAPLHDLRVVEEVAVAQRGVACPGNVLVHAARLLPVVHDDQDDLFRHKRALLAHNGPKLPALRDACILHSSMQAAYSIDQIWASICDTPALSYPVNCPRQDAAHHEMGFFWI